MPRSPRATGFERAPEVAVSTVRSAVQEISSIQEVVCCCFSASDLAVYARRLGEIGA